MNSPHLSLACQSWHPSLIKIVLTTLALSLAATGCSNRNPAPTTPTSPADVPIEKRGDWFCQPAAAGSDEPWECIQDKELATNPKPDRLPNANDNQPSIPPAGSLIDTDPTATNPQINDGDVPLPPQLPPPPPGLSQAPGSDPPGSAQRARPILVDHVTPASIQAQTSAQPRTQLLAQPAQAQPLPNYIRLAFQPEGPVSILGLPSHYYAVQLAALSSTNNIEAFISKHQLKNLTAAKVAINDKVRYVLILGIYDSRGKAELAAADQLPAPLASFTPWIRKLGNLQQAMLAAEASGRT